MKLLFSLVFLGFAAFIQSGCTKYYAGPVSDHFDGRKFYNPGKPLEKNFAAFLKWRMNRDQQFWPEYSDLSVYDHPPDRVYGDALRVSMVGHATVLIQTQGVNILTDPIWSGRASPVKWFGPQRVHPPGIAFEDLPPIDVVLLSHNHYDHLDLETIVRLWTRDRPRIIVPLGNDTLIAESDSSIVAEAYDWGAEVQISPAVAVHLEPMHHWSARGLADRNTALWAAFAIVTDGGNIYFVGDSGYGNGENFRKAREKFTDFRVAILPIGDYDPRWFMAYGHMNPDECLLAFEELGRPRVLPIHYNTFPLADTGYGRPLARLKELITGNPEAEGKFVTLNAGESWDVPK